jgi:hypothetical protein
VSGLSWLQPTEEVVAHLRRDSEKGDGTEADWLVAVRPGHHLGQWEVVALWGPSQAKGGSLKVLEALSTKSAAIASARAKALDKTKDRRYRSLLPLRQQAPAIEPAPVAANLSIGAELKLADWNGLMLRLAPLGLTATSDSTWKAQMEGTGTVLFRQYGDRIGVSGFIAVTDAESRPLFAAVSIVTKARITNASGDEVDLEEWIREVSSTLSPRAADLAADFGLLPKRLDFTNLASSLDTGPWASLI